jgi:hypothetical protein
MIRAMPNEAACLDYADGFADGVPRKLQVVGEDTLPETFPRLEFSIQDHGGDAVRDLLDGGRMYQLKLLDHCPILADVNCRAVEPDGAR